MDSQFFIIGNWKSNKTLGEVKTWLAAFSTLVQSQEVNPAVKLVICAPFVHLSDMKKQIDSFKLPLELGAQNISPFGAGAYTGEITGAMIAEYAQWVLIGHSERRKYFGETDQMLAQKVVQAKDAHLSVIYCVPDEKTVIPEGVDIVAYEPVWAIGTGKTDSPENAAKVIATIKQKNKVTTCIYGGSVTSENIAAFKQTGAVDGVLPGKASLDPESFYQLLTHVA